MFQTKFHIGETLPGKNYIFQLNTTHSCTIDIKTETLHRTTVDVALFLYGKWILATKNWYFHPKRHETILVFFIKGTLILCFTNTDVTTVQSSPFSKQVQVMLWCNGYQRRIQNPVKHLTHLLLMHPFSTPWKHQKTFRFYNVFKGQRKCVLEANGLRRNFLRQ